MTIRTWLPRIVTGVLLAIGFLVSAAVLPELPETVATHWNVAGQVDGEMSRLTGAFSLPVVTALLVPVLYLAPRLDPKREEIEAFRGVYEWFVAGFVGFMLYVHGVVLAWNLGYEFSFNAALAVAFGVLLIGLAEVLVRAEQNWTVGIRTRWTLSDEVVWAETHRRAARAFRLAGVLALVGVVVPSLAIPLLLVGVFGATGYTVTYSYVAYRRRAAA